MIRAFAFDMDGVIVDSRARFKEALKLSLALGIDFWDAFFSEEAARLTRPREAGVRLAREKIKEGAVVLISCRPAKTRRLTVEEFKKYVGFKPAATYLRRGGRQSRSEVKKALLGEALRRGFNIIEYHDDEEEVLKVISGEYPWIKLYLHFNDSYRLFR